MLVIEVKYVKANNKLIVELSKQSSLLIDTDGIYFSALPNGKPPLLLKFAPGFAGVLGSAFPKKKRRIDASLILVVDTVRVSRFSINKREKNFFQYENQVCGVQSQKGQAFCLKAEAWPFQRAPAY